MPCFNVPTYANIQNLRCLSQKPFRIMRILRRMTTINVLPLFLALALFTSFSSQVLMRSLDGKGQEEVTRCPNGRSTAQISFLVRMFCDAMPQAASLWSRRVACPARKWPSFSHRNLRKFHSSFTDAVAMRKHAQAFRKNPLKQCT